MSERAKYAQDVLGLNVWTKYRQIYDLIDAGVRGILIRSCNGAGKSTLVASLLVYEMMHYDDMKCIVTGANSDALKRSTWASMKRFAVRAGVSSKEINSNFWEHGHNLIMAVAPSKIEGGQGFHASRVAVVIDEATAIDGEKIAALMSNTTGTDSLVVFTYNPLNPDAAVYDLEAKAVPFELLLDDDSELIVSKVSEIREANQWVSIGISAFEHPNVLTGFEEIEGAVTRDFIERQLAIHSLPCDRHYPNAIHLDWNKSSWMPTPEALARICGVWSDTQSHGFISGAVVVESWAVPARTGIRIAGADIGGGDDPTVWTHFEGNMQVGFQSLTTNELGVVASTLDKYCRDNNIDVLTVDDTGVGHGVTDRLKELKPPYKLIPIHFGSTPYNFPEVAFFNPSNARSEMYLLLEKQMRSKMLRIAYDKELQRELCCQKLDGHKQSATLRLEDKRLIKKRIGRSPNKADATALAIYGGRVMEFHNRPRMY